ncbi:Bacterial transcription activator, effector binding domain [Chryseobacterium taklimakanense]|uniref:Bacterial transcription activator, effector binding domain n=1 Tax=Chryseobacterium taklimakanense TaxID=536441 RepID=A0A239WE94_9FLAO|nr:Bacterial transcription activator, effector binding domain [Chryseobacterium taklimakanense]
MDLTNGFKIIGIEVRTSNQNNQSQSDLGKLWEQFYSENIIEKIPNKISNEVLSIYTDYKKNYTEDYTTIIGVPVSTLNEIPNGLFGREFDKENFQKFIAKGEMPNAVIKIWSEIWEKDEELNRKYTYDFEVYDAKSQNGENSEVEIYVAVK